LKELIIEMKFFGYYFFVAPAHIYVPWNSLQSTFYHLYVQIKRVMN